METRRQETTGPGGRTRSAPVVVVALLAFVGCADPDERPASWSYLHAAIVVPSCATASCHSDLARAAGIDLSDADDAYDLLLSEQFVIPGDDQSALVHILEGDERVRMPPDSPLPAADVDLFRIWIEEGARR